MSCAVVELAECFVICGCALLDGHLLGERSGLGFGFGVVLYGDFFSVAFVDVHVWSEVF